MADNKHLTLFLCTGNSCRSQIAEALLRHIAGDRFEAASAGSRPAGFVHPLALQTLEQMEVSTEALTSKHWQHFVGAPVTLAITVCDNAAAECPSWPSAIAHGHWPHPDPVFYEGTEQQRLAFCRRTADNILRQLTALSQLPLEQPDRDLLTRKLNEIARRI